MHVINSATDEQVESEIKKRTSAHAAQFTEVIPPMDCGEFRTKWVRSWHPEIVTIGELRFKSPSCYPRAVLLGLNELDIDLLRLRTELCSVADDRAFVNMTVWPEVQHFGSGCSWLSIPPSDRDFQFGSYNTGEDRPSDTSQQSTSRRITFERRYIVQPKVTVWLTAVNCGPDKNPRVRVWADDITREGFTIHVDTWGDTDLWSAGASWLAHSGVRTDVRSGTFQIQDVRLSGTPDSKTRGRVSWGAPRMEKPPRVFAALNMLEFEAGKYCRLSLYTSDVTTTGMSWNLDTWLDTVCYQAGGTFFAFDDSEEDK
ncbi:H-type lectin domain-containing protein [Phanerochaete sordida]|uniref:H-type lectin domain-containing protein n=1 Tax=Phanerochaete sordida TaxID=48140 RepID=A0A9P3FXD3_9APHY|nr:H-type lectin domain-containing protein [Phanerochaete sordida]